MADLLLALLVVVTPLQPELIYDVRGTVTEAEMAGYAYQTFVEIEARLERPITYPELFGMLWHGEVGSIADPSHPFVRGVEEAIAHQYHSYCQGEHPCTFEHLCVMLGTGFDNFRWNVAPDGSVPSVDLMLEIFDNPTLYQRALSAGWRIMARTYEPFDHTDAWSAGPILYRSGIEQGKRDDRGWYAAWVGYPPVSAYPGHQFVVWNSSGIRLIEE
jgi:hypothetical protein